ncbi:MAG TPA: acetyl-CoA hydrolase/transferase C-terminal domain-containing protein [Pseudolabrys sp.]|nr:acetyl-CoA hydrolase/transferase C-terminal domain-containing protein [Pseudolabrys sp.]
MSHSDQAPVAFDDAARLADAILAKVGKTIVLALPLGLGKANHIANALYAKALADRSIRLAIFTALTLVVPRTKNELEHRFLEPISQRVFGGYPALDYANAIRAGTVPPNVEVNEFFFMAGQWLDSPYAQQHYISANYTHALQYVLDRGVNVIGQLVAHRADESHPYSLSCNPDLTLDLLALRREKHTNFVFAGEVNSELPFMRGDAAISGGELDFLLDGPSTDFPLFAPPREPIALADYAAGLHATSLVPDGGTLQIGIGSLGDAVAQGLIMRHRSNEQFQSLLSALQPVIWHNAEVHRTPFASGLYGCSEMFVESLLDLFRAGVLKREVDGAILDSGFFLGSRAFYHALREMPPEALAKFRMRSISFVNEIFFGEKEKRQARFGARFINDAMMATVLGDVISDGLDDGRIVSGVGGQYNFVAQAFALEGARSVIMLRSTRETKGKSQSNIRWRYGHVTIPRHLRDIIVTEYGIADIRGKSDRDVAVAMLTIADSRFQDELLRQAKDARKVERSFQLPKTARNNTPATLARALRPARDAGLLPLFPFGTDFSEIEQRLIPVLQLLKRAGPTEFLALFARGIVSQSKDRDCLERLGLALPKSPAEWLYSALVSGALSRSARSAQ